MPVEQQGPVDVVILTEGGSGIGFGHIMRCLSLWQAFRENGIIPEIVLDVPEGDEAVKGLLNDTEYSILSWRREKDWVASLRDTGIVVIDSYLAKRDIYETISKRVRVPVYLDDNKRIDYPSGIVVNGSIGAEAFDYPVHAGIDYLLGTRYTPLRNEFRDVPKKVIADRIETIMVTFGGNDPGNMIPRFLTAVRERYPLQHKRVILGRGVSNRDALEKAKDERTTIDYNLDAGGMKKVMMESDIAVTACGQTLYELARTGTPAVAVAVAENQLHNAKAWERAGFIQYAGWYEDTDILEKVQSSLLKTESITTRKRMSEAGTSLVDGKGARRVVDFAIKSALCHG